MYIFFYGKAFEKEIKTIEYQGEKLEALELEDHGKQLVKSGCGKESSALLKQTKIWRSC